MLRHLSHLLAGPPGLLNEFSFQVLNLLWCKDLVLDLVFALLSWLLAQELKVVASALVVHLLLTGIGHACLCSHGGSLHPDGADVVLHCRAGWSVQRLGAVLRADILIDCLIVLEDAILQIRLLRLDLVNI